MIRESTEDIVRGGVWGWVDDDLAFTIPWGFDLSEIQVPVEVRYGARDVLVPAAHGAWLGRNVPGAMVVVRRTRATSVTRTSSSSGCAGWSRGSDPVLELRWA